MPSTRAPAGTIASPASRSSPRISGRSRTAPRTAISPAIAGSARTAAARITRLILCAVPGHVVGYRFGPVQREAAVPLGDCVFVIGASGITASKAGEHRERYNQAVESLQTLLGLWRTRTGEMPVTLGALLDEGPETAQQLRAFIEEAPAGPVSADVLRNRLDHFIAETHRLCRAPPGRSRPATSRPSGRWSTSRSTSPSSGSATRSPRRARLPASRAVSAPRAPRHSGRGSAAASGRSCPTARPRSFPTWRAAYEAEFPMLASRAAFFRSHAGPAVLRL